MILWRHHVTYASFPVMETDRKLGEGEITCPMLELDPGTARRRISVSGRVVTNTPPTTPSPDTGCRIQEITSVLASRPLMVRNSPGQQCIYQVNLGFSVKGCIPDKRMMLETALTPTPVGATIIQRTGLSICVVTCPNHKQQLRLRVAYNSTVLRHTHSPSTMLVSLMTCDCVLYWMELTTNCQLSMLLITQCTPLLQM
ncbi:uncharacterized protein LOC124262564 [Haliotis rubra]|uniref:uncharacterized protein LOC124262564 n=1 Tax=Haliotis rubra TaxID=36100 RepID=UPI001EE60C9D|nr:uncharacterized protein LOC124262564 [Haliotis rubra]